MKRILAFLLCLVLVLTIPAVTNANTTDYTAAANEIVSALDNLKITKESRSDLQAINQKIVDYGNTYGLSKYNYIPMSTFEEKVAEYNQLISVAEPAPVFGDVTGDETIDAKDALNVLKISVGKIDTTETLTLLGDVNLDTVVNAKDALMILQLSVGKLSNFPATEAYVPEPSPEPYEIVSIQYAQKTIDLYQSTYETMLTRIRSDGFAQTSLTGAYEGMFPRDSSIQVMAHVAEGDFTQARMILNYLTEYHKNKNLSYVMHIIRTHDSYFKQTDTTFFFLHAWYQFATTAPQTAENKAYIEGSISKVKEFANYYLDNGYLHDKYDLLFNASLEHSRGGNYWQSYDLITNVYASQALYEMSLYFKHSDPTNAQKWKDASDKIAKGIHKNLVAEVDGNMIYAELRGRIQSDIDKDPNCEEKFISGFSWVNLAPMSCDWYAADPKIMDHTYQMYVKYGNYTYRNTAKEKYKMLEACTDYYINKRRNSNGNHVIGKGLAWEMMYCKKMGYTDRLTELTAFVELNSENMYRETYNYGGGGNDGGNQEQAAWMLLAHKAAYPELKK